MESEHKTFVVFIVALAVTVIAIVVGLSYSADSLRNCAARCGGTFVYSAESRVNNAPASCSCEVAK